MASKCSPLTGEPFVFQRQITSGELIVEHTPRIRRRFVKDRKRGHSFRYMCSCWGLGRKLKNLLSLPTTILLDANLSDRRGRQRIRTSDGLPNNSIQFGFRSAIWMAEIPARRLLSPGCIRTIHLGERNLGLERCVRIECRLAVKIDKKTLRSIIEECNAPHAKNLLHRF